MKLNLQHEELPDVPINLIINNYDNVINFSSCLSFIRRIRCFWYMPPLPRNKASSPKIITEFVTYFFSAPRIIIITITITTCEALRAVIVFRYKFPAVHKLIMKRDYRFCDGSYCIDRCSYRPLENYKSGSTHPKCIL